MSKKDEIGKLRGRLQGSVGVNVAPDASLNGSAAPEDERGQGVVRSKDSVEIAIDRIMPDPEQPRKHFDEAEIENLAASLKERGQLQEIRVRWVEANKRYVIITGERRWRAARLAGLTTLRCQRVADMRSEMELLEDQLVENCLREGLKPIEQAMAYRTLLDSYGWSYRQLAERLNMDSGSISKALTLLTLPGEVQEQIQDGLVAPSTAYEVAKIHEPKEQVAVIRQAIEENMSRAQVAEAVKMRTRRPSTIFEHRVGPVKVRVTFPPGTTTEEVKNALSEAIGIANQRVVAA